MNITRLIGVTDVSKQQILIVDDDDDLRVW